MPIGGSSLPVIIQEDSLIYEKGEKTASQSLIKDESKGGKSKPLRNYDKMIGDYCDNHQEELIALLQECVRIPSVTGEEGPIQTG
jgi:hypothetical protein